jgi:hypothetical protein
VGRTEVLNQGLTGFVLQLLKSWRGDADGEGHSCGEDCACGLGFQAAGALSLQEEHDLTHPGDSPSSRHHPWPAAVFWQVRPDMGNRPAASLEAYITPGFSASDALR